MRKTKKLTALVLTSVMAVSVLAGCGSNKTSETAAGADGEKKTLKVAMECGYAPYNWTQPTNDNGAVPISGSSDYAYGYDVKMAQHICDELGYELEIVKLD